MSSPARKKRAAAKAAANAAGSSAQDDSNQQGTPPPKKSPPSYRKFDWSTIGTDFHFFTQYHTSEFEPLKKGGRNKKRKRGDASEEQVVPHSYQKSPYAEKLNTWYSVQPELYWEDCSKYRRFTSKKPSFPTPTFERHS